MSLWRRLEQRSRSTKNYITGTFRVWRAKHSDLAWIDCFLIHISYPLFWQGKNDTKSVSASQDSDRWLGSEGCIVERQRRLTPFNEWSSRSLFLTDPPHLMWSDGRSIPVEDIVADHDWDPLIEVHSWLKRNLTRQFLKSRRFTYSTNLRILAILSTISLIVFESRFPATNRTSL